MTDDLIIEAEDGPWTFSATVECLPKEAKSYAEKVCAPWKQYLRADLAAAQVAAAYERAAQQVWKINRHTKARLGSKVDVAVVECHEAIRALATSDQTAALEAVKREARNEALREAAQIAKSEQLLAAQGTVGGVIEQTRHNISKTILALIEKDKTNDG